MRFGHVFDQLAAYAEDQLSDDERQRVDRHLSVCEVCRSSLADIRHGISLAAALQAEPMPSGVARRIRHELTGESDAPVDRTGRVAVTTALAGRAMLPWWRVAAILVIGAGLVALYWQVNRPWVRLHAASAPPTAFEREGRALHRRIQAGDAPLTFESADEQALWRWLAAEGAPVTSMAISRTAGQRTQFVPLGAAVHRLDGALSSVLSYRVDGHPVTLALASSSDVPDAPTPGWWSKRVTHRRDAGGINTLTWTVGGGTYVMVSELEGAGQKACLICHTSERFADVISGLSTNLRNVPSP